MNAQEYIDKINKTHFIKIDDLTSHHKDVEVIEELSSKKLNNEVIISEYLVKGNCTTDNEVYFKVRCFSGNMVHWNPYTVGYMLAFND